MKNTLNVNDRFVIKSDGLNWTVYERKVNDTEGSDNFGKEYLTNPAHYGRIENLAAYLLRQITPPKEGKLENQINELIMAIEENTKSITAALADALKTDGSR